MMKCYKNESMGQRSQRMPGKATIAIALLGFAWLLAYPEESQAQRSRVYQANVGPVAEKPQTPAVGNAPMILSVTNTANRSVTIKFRDFAAKVSRKTFVIERLAPFSFKWQTVYSMRFTDHRIPFNPRIRDHRRQPGATYVHRDEKGLQTGMKYQYRVRVTIPYEPQPTVLLSSVSTITVMPVGTLTPPIETPPVEPTPEPTPPEETPPEEAPPEETPTAVTKTVNLKAKQIGPFLRPYMAISQISGELREIEIPAVNGEPLRVYFLKPGYKLTEYVSNPDATVMLTTGQTSTPSQINELFGTAQNNRHVKFVAFVRQSQGNRPNSVAIKVRVISNDE